MRAARLVGSRDAQASGPLPSDALACALPGPFGRQLVRAPVYFYARDAETGSPTGLDVPHLEAALRDELARSCYATVRSTAASYTLNIAQVHPTADDDPDDDADDDGEESHGEEEEADDASLADDDDVELMHGEDDHEAEEGDVEDDESEADD